MPQWPDLALPVLIAISNASGDEYRDVEGPELMAELERMGHHPTEMALYNLMFRLRDGGYIEMHSSAYGDPSEMSSIRLDRLGRQQVEGWPRSGQVAESDFTALIEALRERAEDADQPEEVRSRYRTALASLSSLTNQVGMGLITAYVNQRAGLS